MLKSGNQSLAYALTQAQAGVAGGMRLGKGARGLWKQSRTLVREVGGSGGFQKGTRGFGLHHGL